VPWTAPERDLRTTSPAQLPGGRTAAPGTVSIGWSATTAGTWLTSAASALIESDSPRSCSSVRSV
jgi:hypothetical protein